MLEWMQVFNGRGNIAVYASDVAGAFDRVNSKRLAAKLRAKGINKRLVGLLISWLEARVAKVVVGGTFSDEFELLNQVFQGTVLGPLFSESFDGAPRRFPLKQSILHGLFMVAMFSLSV